MDRITFDDLPQMVASILEKLEHIEKLISQGRGVENHSGKEMLTIDDAVKFTGLSKSSLYKMSFNRDIPVYKPTGRKLYFKKEDMINYLHQNRVMSGKEIEQQAINYVINNPIGRKKQ